MGTRPPEKIERCDYVLAIDFETANTEPASACALGATLLRGSEVVATKSARFRPYTGQYFCFTDIHGIRWNDVRNEPHFDAVWRDFQSLWEEADLIIAHNASFDMRVLFACARQGGFVPEPRWYSCTVEIARSRWPEFPNHKLNTLCDELNIDLAHHNAESDATACAAIYVAATRENTSIYIYENAGWTTTNVPASATYTRRDRIGRQPVTKSRVGTDARGRT